MVSELDDKMLSLNEAIQACLEQQEGVQETESVASVAEHLLGKREM